MLLHGWGMNLEVFQPLRARLEHHYTVTAIDLPGHGASGWSEAWSAADQLERLSAAIPRHATLAGWSFGGQLALRLVERCLPRRLILIATTPRFLRGDGWEHGLAEPLVQRFAEAMRRDQAACLHDFIELQARGSTGAAQVRTQLQRALALGGTPQPSALEADLTLLEQQDLRLLAARIAVPALVVCGEHDQVMPGAGPALAALLPRARLLQLPRAAHAPFLSHPDQVAAALRHFTHGSAEAPAA